VLVETLVAFGVRHVFGMVGHSNLGFADALRRAEQRGEISYVGIRHEGAAAFAASAYGKLTGRPALCLAIAGPGSTNLLTGPYDARLDQSPVLAISGQVASKVLGRGAFQDLNLSAVFKDVATSSVTLQAGSDHAELAALAVKRALDRRGADPAIGPTGRRTGGKTGRPGRDAAGRGAGRRRRMGVHGCPPGDRGRPRSQGCSGPRPRSRRTPRRPGADNIQGQRADTGQSPARCRVLGRSGTPVASWLMNESDLVIAIGASFANPIGIATYQPIIQIDDDPTAIGRFDPVAVSLVGDAAATLDALVAAVMQTAAIGQRADVAERWAIWRAEKARRVADDRARGSPRLRSSMRCPGIYRPTPCSPSTSGTTPIPWGAISNRRASRR